MRQDAYKVQNRGGVGMSGIKTKEDDDVCHIIPTCTHDYLYFFTNLGRVYAIKGYQIPEFSRQAKGLPLVNLITFAEDEKLTAVTSVPASFEEGKYLFFVTKKGLVKRSSIKEFENIRTNGKIAITLRDGDELFGVSVTDGTKDIVLGSTSGKSIRFNEEDVRCMGRSASGVRGMNLTDEESIIGQAIIDDTVKEILVITENGYGKRSLIEEYRCQTRGGMGIKALNVTEKNGPLNTLRTVTEDNDIIITTDKGMVIRIHAADISLTGRNSQGVRLIKLREDHKISNIAVVDRDDTEEVETVDNSEEE